MSNSTQNNNGLQLVGLCAAYFCMYTITGVQVKYYPAFFYQLPAEEFPNIHYLVDSSLGSTILILLIVFSLGWYRFNTSRKVKCGPVSLPSELAFIIPSGVCTTLITVATVLLYSLPISVMVATVIMRGSVIVLCRLIDAIQVKQGLLKKKVYWEENLAVVLALLTVMTNLINTREGDFAFLGNWKALTILAVYIGSYAIRLYVMNYYKNTRSPDVEHDSKGYFALEQISGTVAFLLIVVVMWLGLNYLGWSDPRALAYQSAISHWDWNPIFWTGAASGLAVLCSTMIFLFKGRTATFVGLLNRLTSLLAGVVATLVFAIGFGGKYPDLRQWVSVGLIILAFYLLTRAEKRRAAVTE